MFESPVVLLLSASLPVAVLLTPSVLFKRERSVGRVAVPNRVTQSAPAPVAVSLVGWARSAPAPVAVGWSVLLERANAPLAVLPRPVVLLKAR